MLLQDRDYLCVSVIKVLFSFIVCMQAAFKFQAKGLLKWVWKDKKYIHT